ncbi:hypothetical protein L226DRAFT_46284 [Lentinus tigrinus ALCF2SS1-7]|uniref:uncharacterized protein n=1 Tax=Lentinus tigrinus ALCF2SS1-7 TaxID=1328758 RepID=UPI001165F1BB|nr:hypothetical protein L226DRAFT_46284 [Lentinus tigrinus ALCF2SS1-7]
MGYPTLTDLPVEVLHLILAHFDYDQEWQWKHERSLRSCSFTCRLVRAVALEHLDFRHLFLPGIETFDPLLDFLRTYPRVAKTVVSLKLAGSTKYDPGPRSRYTPMTTIDVALLASIVELLPKLDSLILQSFHYTKPTAANVQPAVGPFPLSTFSLRGHCHPQSSLTGVLSVLSLFTLEQVKDPALDEFDLDESSEPRFLSRLVDVQRLWLRRSSSPAYTASALQAFSVSLKSDSLQELSVQVDSKETISALGKLLTRAGGNITTLTIRNNPPEWAMPKDRDHWVNPLEGNSQLLDISACKKLESITLPMYFCKTRTRPLSEPVVGILQQASTTLRKVIIIADNLPKPTTIGNRTIYKVHDLDKVLSPTRFPHLQECELNIGIRCTPLAWSKCKDSAQRALKSLHGRGLLTMK